MIHDVAEKIVDYLESRHIITASTEEREIYVYGFDIAIYSVVSTLGLLLIGLLLSMPMETCVLVTVFYINQTFGGGFHANSHAACFFVMSMGLFVFRVLMLIKIPISICCVAAVLSIAVFFHYPVILHKNKLYLKYKIPSFTKRSYLITGLESAAYFLLLIMGQQYQIQVLAVSMMLCAISRTAAAVRQRKEIKNQNTERSSEEK